MSLPALAYQTLAPGLTICRLLNGLWQVSGAHGHIDQAKAIAEMLDYHDAGFTTWDLADHYGPAEDFIGLFRKKLAQERGNEALQQSQAFTKWVPRPGRMSREGVEQAIHTSLRRMGVETLDLLQFHWWDYRDMNYLDALRHLSDLQRAGKIRYVALTNFDTERLKLISEHGLRIASNQVQFSLVDRRPMQQMSAFCRTEGIQLLTYGTYCGGLLSEAYVGAPEPDYTTLNTASLRKYKNMIDAWGDWSLFQELLRVCQQVARKHGVSLANVAVRYVLEQPAVGGVIVGARLGVTQHRTDNARVFTFALDAEDRALLEAASGQGRDLMQVIGDCGDEYRRTR